MIGKYRLFRTLRLLAGVAASLVLLAAPAAFAGVISAELSETDIAVGEGAMLTITIQGSHDDEPEVKVPAGLVIQRQGVSQSMSFINGAMSREKRVSYVVAGEKAGEYEIPAIKLEIDGKAESTLPLKLRVREGGAVAPQQNGKEQEAETSTGQQKFGIFIKRRCPEQSFLPGEPIPCQIRIYHKGHLRAAQRVTEASPDFRKFTPEGERNGQETINGEAYAYIEVPEVYVASSPGKKALPPFSIEARFMVRGRGQNTMDQFMRQFGGGMSFDMGFAEERTGKFSSQTTEVTIDPLPPPYNQGEKDRLIGKFTAQVEGSPTTVKVGETVTITVKVSGQGLLDDLVELPLDLSSYGKVYPDKPTLKDEVTQAGELRAERVFKFALVPKQPGTINIPAIKILQFDPKSRTGNDLDVTFPTITVLPASDAEAPLQVGGTHIPEAQSGKEEVKLQEPGRIAIFRGFTPDSTASFTSRLPLLLMIAGSNLLVLTAFWMGPRFKRKRRYSPLDHFTQDLERRGAYKALILYLATKLSKAETEVKRSDIDNGFKGSRHFPDLAKLLNDLERAEFAQTHTAESDQSSLANRAGDLVRNIEEERR